MNSLIRSGQSLPLWRKLFTRTSATAAEFKRRKAALTYDEFMRLRQTQAKRSIIVQVHSEKSFPELYNYCSAYGSIVSAHHYHVRNEDEMHFILLEFACVPDATAAIDSSTYNDEYVGVPSRSPFLWFKAAHKRMLKKFTPAVTNAPIIAPTLAIVEGTNVLTASALNTLLQAAPNIEQQIHILHRQTQLSDLGVRLRFLAALQVQEAVVGMFPFAVAQPFGSSVNGFGKMGCDLDLILRFDREICRSEADKRNESRLVFHTKENISNGRSQTQRQMECIGDMLQLFLPGVCHVRRILQARIPIIKYHHEHLNLEVDLSMSNLTGSYMSELFYMFGELDDRVRPLVFCIRRWATACGLTNPSPGRWISNFALTCLAIFFLQQMKQPLLPTINAVMQSATANDVRVTEDGINCSFGRDFERIGIGNDNYCKIHELLLQFFEFYSQFDFNNRAISLNEGRAVAKPDHSALYIINPLEQVLNVSKNVSLEECERLRIEVRNAAWVLESEVENAKLSQKEKLDTPWGLLNLFKSPESAIVRPNMFFKPRMVEVSDLFEKTGYDSNEHDSVANNAAKMLNATAVNYKNPMVRQQVQTIKSHYKLLRGNAASAAVAAAPPFMSNTPKGKRSR